MSQCRFLLCEKTSRWAVALRRALGERGRWLVETRSLPQCGRELKAFPASLVAVEISESNAEAALGAIARWSQRFPSAHVMALIDSSLTAAEPLIREAGAIGVLASTRDAIAAANLFGRHAVLAPALVGPLEQSILAELPWQRWATRAS
jgi:hypothetical protein